jgi:hypothetical protein
MVDEIVCFKKSKSHWQIVEMHNYYLWSIGWRCYYPWDNGIDVNFKVIINFKIIIITSKKYSFISNHYIFIEKIMKSWITLDYLDRNEICNLRDKKTFYIGKVHVKHAM